MLSLTFDFSLNVEIALRGIISLSSPKPMRPRVSPRILAAPDATSRICSTLWTRVPSRRAWYSQVFRRYRLRMWQSVESAVSSTAAEGMLHTAMPWGKKRREKTSALKMTMTSTLQMTSDIIASDLIVTIVSLLPPTKTVYKNEIIITTNYAREKNISQKLHVCVLRCITINKNK